jgi:hypothetical protein
MDAQAVVSVSAAVVALTQFAKWSKLPDKYGPLAVLLLAAIGVVLWGWSVGDFERTKAFAYFAGWIAVATSAAGVWGFSRASAEALTKVSPPPGGAINSPTVKTE